MRKGNPELLAKCLSELETGRLTVEECLRTNPDAADELRGLLEVASAIEPPRPVVPDPGFRSRGREALLAAISGDLGRVRKSPLQRFWDTMFGGRVRPPRIVEGGIVMRPALIAALAILLVAASGGAAVYASQDALPDDPLYRVKTTVEELQLALAPDEEAKASTYLDLTAKRVAEIQKATQQGRAAAISAAAEAFVQNVEQIGDRLDQAAADGRDVSGLAVLLTENLAQHQAALASAQDQAAEPAKPALEKASRAAKKGLATALMVAGGSDHGVSTTSEKPGKGHGRPTTAPATPGSPTPAGTQTAGQATATGTPLAASATISPTVVVSFTQMITTVEALESDPDIRGNSYRGLLAKLEAAEAAYKRGKTDTALNILNAFLHELNAFRQADHVSDANYNSLYSQYSALVAGFGGTPVPQTAPARGSDEGERPKAKETPPGQRGREDEGPRVKETPPGQRGRGGDTAGATVTPTPPGTPSAGQEEWPPRGRPWR